MEHKNSLVSEKIGGDLAEKKLKLAKSDSRYWAGKLERPACTKNGERLEGTGWAVRIMHAGRREYFNLGTSNRVAAARKAADVWVYLRANGWEATLAKFKPRSEKPDRIATVGEFIGAAERAYIINPRTFAGYARSLRLIAAGVARIPQDAARFAPCGTAKETWLSKVNGVSLADLTLDAVQQWKKSFLAASATDPKKAQARARSVNSIVRQAKTLFSPKHVKFLNLNLPSPVPFAGLDREKEGSYRYVTQFDVIELLTAAKEELAESRPEEFKVFLLAVAAGLRRGEIDKLEWSAIDFEGNRIIIRPTEFLSPKSNDSAGEVMLDAEIAQILKEFHAKAKSRFVIESSCLPRRGLKYTEYRCEEHFGPLLAWLREKGVTQRNALHALRKEFGSRINELHGIYAASLALRHADIGITTRHYVHGRMKATPGFGALLRPQVADLDKAS